MIPQIATIPAMYGAVHHAGFAPHAARVIKGGIPPSKSLVCKSIVTIVEWATLTMFSP